MFKLGLTHNREGVPKFNRENTEQFFAAVARKNSTVLSTSLPIFSAELEQHDQQKQNNDEDEKDESLSTKPVTPIVVLPPIRTATGNKSKTIPSASVCVRQPTFHSPIPSSELSLQSTSPIIKSPRPILLPKRQFQHGGPVDQDIFRKAYERALSVARSRLLFRDPYSLTRASATHGVLYSYYDHTPMCIFSRGTACNHHQDTTSKQDRKLKTNILRKKIFNDVIVENYIR
ncbi:unnamed protein product [Rotaria sp. Silwood1]|nr:unnamed protein product [Rotaria sp. Silwood1]CAF4594192.1 unnamed protein product [Rotaria sp. Silwood1]